MCAPAAPLLLSGGALPDEASCLGPVWLERWTEVPAQEAFRFDALVEAHAGRKTRLVKACWRIAAMRELPGPLRRAARDVGAILARPDDLQALDFSVRKTSVSRHAWGCLPVDHVRFCRSIGPDDQDGSDRVQEPETWLEDWAEVPAQEAFRFDALVEAHAERKSRLVKACWRIAATRELPGPLRRAARDVGGILARPDDLQALDFSVRKASASRHAWGCLPVDHVRFCRSANRDDGDGRDRVHRVQEPEAWLEALGRCAAAEVTPSALLPVLPYFKSYPFAVVVARGDATGLARVFDDRYFMASTELNLLNTLLFVSEHDAQSASAAAPP